MRVPAEPEQLIAWAPLALPSKLQPWMRMLTTLAAQRIELPVWACLLKEQSLTRQAFEVASKLRSQVLLFSRAHSRMVQVLEFENTMPLPAPAGAKFLIWQFST